MKKTLTYKELQCSICNRIYQYHHDDHKGHSLIHCNSCKINTRRFALKDKALAYKGGSCQHCGYNKCKRALQFHHTDPHTKEFQISGSHCRKWSVLAAELDKCLLLCSNCHAEEHERLEINLPEQLRRTAAIEAMAKLEKLNAVKPKTEFKTLIWPSDNELRIMLEKSPGSRVAAELGVSASGLLQYCKKRNIPTMPSGYWERKNNAFILLATSKAEGDKHEHKE